MSRPKKRQVRKVYRTYGNMLMRNEHHELARFKMHYPAKARVRVWERIIKQTSFDPVDDRKLKKLVNQTYLETKRAGDGFNLPEYRRKLRKIRKWRKRQLK
ncbi:hypothetical protein [Levilactobacillus brevis]|uniref:hypothetical protein n=1 Tax=Levilactobacillus brevis TaxID=1580 RepID=UPI00046311B2|nr:hypothetical protein [Levilactobacillus brevis]